MRYQFFDPGDEKLIETSEMPVEGVIAVALRTTGYDVEADEVLQLAIVDLEGAELFSKTVKPQNVEEWSASDTAGGIAPADVADLPELYQFEQEVSDLFENASIVVALHEPFMKSIIEQSWVTLPAFTGFDLVEGFRASHCTDDYKGEPAAAVSLEGIVGYYGLTEPGDSLVDEARAIAVGYRALVKEHADERQAKGAEYWARRDERLAEENAHNELIEAVRRKREKNFNRMNGLLWVAGALIFVSLTIQLYQRGADAGFMVVTGAVAAFALTRAVVNFRR